MKKTDKDLLSDFYNKIVRENGFKLPRATIDQTFDVMPQEEKKALEESLAFARFRLAYRWTEFKTIIWIKFLRIWRTKAKERNISS